MHVIGPDVRREQDPSTVFTYLLNSSKDSCTLGSAEAIWSISYTLLRMSKSIRVRDSVPAANHVVVPIYRARLPAVQVGTVDAESDEVS
jgi:hypothetical protein